MTEVKDSSPPPGARNNTSNEKERGRSSRRASSPEADDIGKVTVLDVLRVLGGVLLLNFALSWYITGESFLWGWRPWFSRPDGLKAWLVSCVHFFFSGDLLGLIRKGGGWGKEERERL